MKEPSAKQARRIYCVSFSILEMKTTPPTISSSFTGVFLSQLNVYIMFISSLTVNPWSKYYIRPTGETTEVWRRNMTYRGPVIWGEQSRWEPQELSDHQILLLLIRLGFPYSQSLWGTPTFTSSEPLSHSLPIISGGFTPYRDLHGGLFCLKTFYWSLAGLQCYVNFVVHQSDSIKHIYIYILFHIFFPIMVYHRILNIVPCIIQ